MINRELSIYRIDLLSVSFYFSFNYPEEVFDTDHGKKDTD